MSTTVKRSKALELVGILGKLAPKLPCTRYEKEEELPPAKPFADYEYIRNELKRHVDQSKFMGLVEYWSPTFKARADALFHKMENYQDAVEKKASAPEPEPQAPAPFVACFSDDGCLIECKPWSSDDECGGE